MKFYNQELVESTKYRVVNGTNVRTGEKITYLSCHIQQHKFHTFQMFEHVVSTYILGGFVVCKYHHKGEKILCNKTCYSAIK